MGKGGRSFEGPNLLVNVRAPLREASCLSCVAECVCECVCVYERERERERKKEWVCVM